VKTLGSVMLLASASLLGAQDMSVRSFGETRGDGKTDDTNLIASCVQQARKVGGICHLPPGDYKVMKTIRIVANPLGPGQKADGSSIGISGDGHSAVPNIQTGSRIICGMRDGSPCLDIDVTHYSILTLYLSHLAFVGPDSGPADAASGEAIRIHGGSEPHVRADDLSFTGFYGQGKFAFSAEGPEGSTFRDIYCAFNNACFHGFNAFNGNMIENINVIQCTGPKAVLIENADALSWIGGILQSNAGTALYLHGILASWFRGTHFECNNTGNPIKCSDQKPAAGGGAIVIEASEGFTNQTSSFENLVLNGANDKIAVYSSDGKGASVFLKFENFYNGSVLTPKMSFDSSTSQFRTYGVAAEGQYIDKGKDNVFCLGSKCSGASK
jgi:hypothetical protein